jgi:hypothetical protein
MERERLGPFAPGGLAGRIQARATGTTARRCLGEIESAEPVRRGYRLRGWIAPPAGEVASRNLAVLDGTGRQVGLGLVGLQRPGVAGSSEWRGFAAYLGQEPRGPSTIVLLAADRQTPVCRLSR